MALPKYVLGNTLHARTLIQEALGLLAELPLPAEPTEEERLAQILSGQANSRYLIRRKLEEAFDAINLHGVK